MDNTDNTTTGPGAATLGRDSTGHQDTTLLLLCSPAGSLCACSQSSVPALQYLASVISHGDLASYSRAIPLQPATIPALCLGADHCGHKANVLVWRLGPWCQDSEAHSFIPSHHGFGDLLVCEFCPLGLMQTSHIIWNVIIQVSNIFLHIWIGTIYRFWPKPHKVYHTDVRKYSILLLYRLQVDI